MRTVSLKGNLVIRTIKTRDMPRIYEIERLSFKEPYPPAYLDDLASYASDTFLVVEENSQVLGYVIATIEANYLGHIISIAVHPEHRRKGLGKLLMKNIIDLLARKGVSTIRLEVRRGNVVAQRLYKKFGFNLAYVIGGYYSDGEDALVFLKNL
ncbi:ribosomal protein S18-alanine N-acetyltransferase [Candidatus Bathyarchaeota archaeon]|nr:ribosomal protein S18-alanine N-acetyltransferase [Candidatus Bathyarchaeota archaeon]